MSKKFNKNDGKKSTAKKVIAIIAAVLAVVIVAGVLVIYQVYDSGYIQKHTTALESENYTISSAMLTYYYNSVYQNFVSSYGSTLSSLGLDTTKSLKSQQMSGGNGTWYDYFMNTAQKNAKQLLVLCEAAKADGIELTDDQQAEIDETVKTMKSNAKSNNVSLDYYLSRVYGSCVDEGVLRKCLELSEIASHYSEHMTEQYNFTESDWDNYYSENKSTFLKADWLTYAFTADAETLADDATDEEKAAADTKRKEEYETLKSTAAELAATTDADAFSVYVESWLRTVKYAGMDEDALKKDNVDISALVDGCKKTGNTNSSESDLNTWAFSEDRQPYDTKVISDDEKYTVTVYMILPAADSSDLGLACQYRDTYLLKNYTYIPFLVSDYSASADDAKAAAEKVLDQFNEDPTADNIAKLSDSEGGTKREDSDKGAVCDEVDEWLYDSARKEGDCAVVTGTKGSYVVYYAGDGDIKWQAQANNSLMSEKYDEEYSALAEKYTVTISKNGVGKISEILINTSSASSSN